MTMIVEEGSLGDSMVRRMLENVGDSKERWEKLPHSATLLLDD